MEFGPFRKGPGRVGHDADIADVAEGGEEDVIEKLAVLIDGPSPQSGRASGEPSGV